MKSPKTIIFTLITSLMLSLPAFALELQEAKDKGLVGELASGYLGSPQGQPNAEVKALISDINSKRKAKYQEIAQSQNLPLEAVEKLAGEKAFEKTASGHFVNIPGAGWKKK